MIVPESIRELRGICQLSPQWQVHQPWAFLQIRRASIYLTWILLHLPVTANGVSLVGIIAGIGASVLFGSTHFVAGAVTLQLAILCDFSDGEVSRYRQQQSKQGSYLDKVYHFTVQPSVFAGVTISAYQIRPSLWVLVAGFISTISVSAFAMVAAYANELAIWKHSKKLVDKLNATPNADPRHRSAVAEFVRPRPTHAQTNASVSALHNVKQSQFAHRLSESASLWDFPYIFFVITAAVIVQHFIPVMTAGPLVVTPLEITLLFYALTYPCWIALYVFYVLATQSTEKGYLAFAHDLRLLMAKTSGMRADELGA
jgi:phosphatidylglycerophosphate synthase